MKWKKDGNGGLRPVYTDAEAQRIAMAAWAVHDILPHPDDDSDHERELRELNRALHSLPPARYCHCDCHANGGPEARFIGDNDPDHCGCEQDARRCPGVGNRLPIPTGKPTDVQGER